MCLHNENTTNDRAHTPVRPYEDNEKPGRHTGVRLRRRITFVVYNHKQK